MKNNKEILEQLYLTAEDLTKLIPELHIKKARKFISEIQEEMKSKGMYIPSTKKKVASTNLVRKKLGL